MAHKQPTHNVWCQLLVLLESRIRCGLLCSFITFWAREASADTCFSSAGISVPQFAWGGLREQIFMTHYPSVNSAFKDLWNHTLAFLTLNSFRLLFSKGNINIMEPKDFRHTDILKLGTRVLGGKMAPVGGGAALEALCLILSNFVQGFFKKWFGRHWQLSTHNHLLLSSFTTNNGHKTTFRSMKDKEKYLRGTLKREILLSW